MTNTLEDIAFSPPGGTAPEPPRHRTTARTGPGKLLRSVWRTHFYAALFAAPVLVMMAITGLVMLYTDPIEGALHGNLTRVHAQGPALSLDRQRAAAVAAAPPGQHLTMVTPSSRGHSTLFQFTANGSSYTDVYVDPADANVLGSRTDGDDIVGLANRLHGSIDTKSVTIPVPSLAHLIDPGSGPVMARVPVGDLVIEIAAGWSIVLALSGIYLWFPRQSQKGKALIKPRLHKKGRLRWRDVHAVSGILGAATMLVFLTSGLPWSTYWGNTWSTAAARITPPSRVEAPSSTAVRAGTLDRFGHRIPWATKQDPIPNSTRTAPAALPLAEVDRIAHQEGMRPGYSITLPTDTTGGATTTYGSYQLSNAWPARLGNEQTRYLDQFTGATLARSGPDTYGAVQEATEVGVLTHMGTQFGIVDRIVMTLGCLLLLTTIATSVVMWWLRRPSGRLGLPKRQPNPRLPRALAGSAIVVGLVYPLWGVSAVVVLLLDALVIRKIRPLRRAFGAPA